jgi:hypothetical protein
LSCGATETAMYCLKFICQYNVFFTPYLSVLSHHCKYGEETTKECHHLGNFGKKKMAITQ